MYLATFVVTVYDVDTETGRSDISYNEVGSTEIDKSDILAALAVAREQADLIVAGLRQAGFKNLDRKDCQIHIRPACLQYMIDGWELKPGFYETITGQKVHGYFIDDPRNNLAVLNTRTAPKGTIATGAKPTQPKSQEDPSFATTVDLDSPERKQRLLDQWAGKGLSSVETDRPTYSQWLANRLKGLTTEEWKKEFYKTDTLYSVYQQEFPDVH